MPNTQNTAQKSSKLWLALAAAFLGWMFDGLEMGIFPLIARPALQQMQTTAGVVDDAFVGGWMGIITALFLIGAACGGVVFGWMGDRFGRVRALSMSIITYSLFTALVYFARTPWELGGLRFLAALGMGGEWALGVALVLEIWPEKNRAPLAGWIGAAGNMGFLLSATVGLTFAVTKDSWRWVAVVGAAPALMTFFIRLCVPESEKWKHAVSIATEIKPLKVLFSRKLMKTTLIATVLSGIMLTGTWGAVQWFPLWAGKLAGTAIPKAGAWAQAWSAFGAVVGCLCGAWLGQRCGRRMAYFLLCAASLVSCQFMFRTVEVYGNGFLALTFLVGGITAAVYGLLPMYLAELFPTRARTTGQGLAYNGGRIITAFGAYYSGALVKTQFDGSYAKAGAVISLVYVVGMVLIWFAPETHGKPLPE